MMVARRSFDLPHVPDRAILYITADTRYQLFVNGTFVARGPARSAAHHQSYDAIDIAHFLHSGGNLLAIRFHHTGIARPYHNVTRPGLLAQLEMRLGNESRILGTNGQWKAIRDPSWDSGSPRLNHWHDAYLDIVDLRKALDKWMMPDFDDSRWPAALSIIPGGVTPALEQRPIGELWWPAPQADYVPQALTPPWVELVPRDLPMLSETIRMASHVIMNGALEDTAVLKLPDSGDPAFFRFDRLPLLKLPSLRKQQNESAGVEGLDLYREGKAPLVLRNTLGQSQFLLFDFGSVYSAHPRLDIEGPAGAIIDVLSTPFLLGGNFNPTVLSSFAADRLVLSGHRQQWEAFFFKPVRYLAIVVRGATAPVNIHFAGITQVDYPWKRPGRFKSPENPWLEDFWKAGAKTIEVITTDAYTDNYRERRQYSQTSYYAARGNYAAFGDPYLQRRYLIQNAQEQEPNGALGAYAPITDGRFMPFFDAQFFWVMGWHDYLLFTGDRESAAKLLPTARRVMRRLAELTESSGLISDPPYPYWIDHSNLDRRGANFVVNALYALALDDYAEALEWLGAPDDDSCRKASAQIREVLRNRFWNPRRALFVDALVEGKQSERISEHANAIAIAANIATPEQRRTIVPSILKPDRDIVPVTSLFAYWTFRALCDSGHTDDTVAMLETRFGHQLKEGSGTLWEEWYLDRTMRRGFWEKATRADAQGECGIFPMALTRWIGGVEPVSPGMREVRIRRVPTTLQNIGTVTPSPLGDLHVTWSADERGSSLTTVVPSGMLVKVDLESLGTSASTSLKIDGRPIGASDTAGRWFTLPVGSHRMTFGAR